MENNFGEFFKQKRLEKNLTQKELAKTLFVSESAVSKWEKNVAHPDITLLPKLSKILGVTEHELITASIDKDSRKEKVQAKRWRTFSFSWSMFFYISYIISILTCFICNLAVSGKLSWFWIVLSALLLSFSFTNLPKLIKKHKLILIPLSMFLTLCLLLAVCCIYTKGDWFWIAAFSVFFALILIFTPIYISKYKIFSKVKNYNDFLSIFIDFVALNILLLIIYSYTIKNGIVNNNWYIKIALPLVVAIYVFLNILLSVRVLKINKLLKTSIILTLIDILYLVIPFIRLSNLNAQFEIDKINIFKADFLNWKTEIPMQNNIHCIIFLTMISLAIIFIVFGLMRHIKQKKS